MPKRKHFSMSELSRTLGVDRKKISASVDVLGIDTVWIGRAKCIDGAGVRRLRKALKPKPEYAAL